jgi:heme A synthase
LNRLSLIGAIGAVGLVIQILLGLGLAGSSNPKGSALIVPHLVIGVAGIALLAYLVSGIFRAGSSGAVKGIYSLALILTLAQVALGFSLLATGGSTSILMAHQGIAFLILILLAVGGMVSARSRRTMSSTTGAPS